MIILKKIKYFAFLFVLNRISPIENSHLILTMPIIYEKIKSNENIINKNEEELISIYYKGSIYKISINKTMGGFLQLYDNEFNQSMTIIVTDSLIPRKKETRISGFILPEEANFAWYQISYIINSNAGYDWKIKKIDMEGQLRIPDSALIILGNSKNISLQSFDNSFTPSCAISANKNIGTVLLPSLKIKNSVGNGLACAEINSYHSEAKSYDTSN